MAMRAYVLIEAAVGKPNDVAKSLLYLKSREIKSVDLVTGPYDVIAVIENDDMNDIGRLVTDTIHPIPGVVRTVTCFSVRI